MAADEDASWFHRACQRSELYVRQFATRAGFDALHTHSCRAVNGGCMHGSLLAHVLALLQSAAATLSFAVLSGRTGLLGVFLCLVWLVGRGSHALCHVGCGRGTGVCCLVCMCLVLFEGMRLLRGCCLLCVHVCITVCRCVRSEWVLRMSVSPAHVYVSSPPAGMCPCMYQYQLLSLPLFVSASPHAVPVSSVALYGMLNQHPPVYSGHVCTAHVLELPLWKGKHEHV